jgi:site-specific recombinase XerD
MMANYSELLYPTPLELIKTPTAFTGESGTNRAPSFIIKQIAANNDLEAIQTWLLEFADSPQTQRSYRKEAERLLLWSIIEKRKAFSSLMRDDLRDYQQFLIDPQPNARWCGQRKPRHHPDWRPFEGYLSADSVAQAMSIINTLFGYLVEAGYLSGNPLGLIRRQLKKRAQQKQKIIERFLEQPLWRVVVDYIQSLPQLTPHDKKHYERIRFLFSLLYLLGPRVSEVANHKMNSIREIRGKWWWFVTGKGQKTEKIPMNDDMLKSLIRYRQYYGLPHLPLPDEDHYLFMNFNGSRGVSANMIYRMVKKIFLDCAEAIKKTQPEFTIKLKKASTHWLRHTSITHQTDAGIELRYIKRNARHESVETTMLYQHAEEDLWHAAMSQHKTVMGDIKSD